jgi:hypothetical protein
LDGIIGRSESFGIHLVHWFDEKVLCKVSLDFGCIFSCSRLLWYGQQRRMGREYVGDDLDGDDLKGIVALGETVQEKSKVLLSKVLTQKTAQAQTY